MTFSSLQTIVPSCQEAFIRLLDRKRRFELLEDPFCEQRLEVLGKLSSRILRTRPSEPALAALGSWLRPAHLREMLRNHAEPLQQDRSAVLAPVGLVFHIAPANVDSMFIYSWALSYLCGNVNIVRLPQDRGPLLSVLLDLLLAHGEDHPLLLEGNAFITYPHQAEITAEISAHCDHRVVWGGDETVSKIRAIPLNPHASERSFPSKHSLAILDSQSVINASVEERKILASQLYADVFPFDQLACSSPQVFCWVGKEEHFCQARELFERAMTDELERRQEPLDAGRAVMRHNFAFEFAAGGQGRTIRPASGFTSISLTSAASVNDFSSCGAGTFIHVRMDALADIFKFIDSTTQTLVHWGITHDQILSVARKLAQQGVDRIVPPGQALYFSPLWDSYNLFDDFTRKLSLRPA